ncbi:hypothetical protein H4R20_001740 [Coemansia guatemalensis]|uniref:CCHC-type domain-containing protein n=1 Tax=Coemansia guatemalensis TaxID=2761395 RepID=A0A9W8LUN2_9FUNG|nr:hypothetical protein H4R20_001740 [Coemansia guatemalensis]
MARVLFTNNQQQPQVRDNSCSWSQTIANSEEYRGDGDAARTKRYNLAHYLLREQAQRLAADEESFFQFIAKQDATVAGPAIDNNPPSDMPLTVLNPPQVRGKGRPKTKRIRSAFECNGKASTTERLNSCGNCGQKGHNIRSCTHNKV